MQSVERNHEEMSTAELDRTPTANWVLADACLLTANRLVDDSSLDFSAVLHNSFIF